MPNSNESEATEPASFSRRLDDIARRVEQRLTVHLEPSGGQATSADRLAEAMRYAALGGGKRIRPFLLIASASLFGVSSDHAMEAACALECVHCYSLIHDDLPAMDDDNMRRGRPSLHIVFGEAAAILAGDSLLTLAFEILSRPQTHPDPQIRTDLVLRLARAAGWCGMAGGQSLDVETEGKRLNEGQIAAIQALKTGALFQFACEAGAILGGGDARARNALGSFGAMLGTAFQLADDLLDMEGDAAHIGKATQKDHAAGKATLVTLSGAAASHARLEALEVQAISALEPYGERGLALAEAVRFVARRAH